MHYYSDSGGEKLLEIMSRLQLTAVSTCTVFKPKRNSKLGNATYIGKSKDCIPSQIDYVLMSKRYKSDCTDCKTQWGPTMYRFGHKFDHAAVLVSLVNKVKCCTSRPVRPNLALLRDDAEVQAEFNDNVKSSLLLLSEPQDSLDNDAKTLRLAITDAISNVPPKPRISSKLSYRSQATKDLHAERESAIQSDPANKRIIRRK
jgi:hypothetical protein